MTAEKKTLKGIAAEKKAAALKRKKELDAIELKKPTFANRIKLLGFVEQGMTNVEQSAQWACQALFGKFIDELSEEELVEVEKYSNTDIGIIAERAIGEFGNPTQG